MDNFICRVCGCSEFVFSEENSIYFCENCSTTFIDPNSFSLPVVKFVKLSDKATIPIKAHFDDSGFDLFSVEDIEILPGEVKLIKTNIAIELPKNHEAQVRCRSSFGKKGIFLANGVGTVDCGYRNDIGILLYNSTSEPFKIDFKDRVAQLIISKSLPYSLEETDELSESERNLGGFGSTGK